VTKKKILFLTYDMGLISGILHTLPRKYLIKISLWLRPAMDVWYRGNRFTDPINGKSYRKFLAYGYRNLRPNALSPGTLSLERHRLLWLFLKEKTDFFSARLKVLHIAPEQAFYKRFKALSHLDYTTADLYSPIADVKADITALPFSDDSFDVILCNHVLEHIPNDTQAMKELYRVMKPGGWGVFQVPLDPSRDKTYEDPAITSPEQRKIHFGQYDHVRIYGNYYYERLAYVGFKVQQIDMRDSLPAKLYQRYALPEKEIIPFCTKAN
jgi:SAM-dependent methyltransferase